MERRQRWFSHLYTLCKASRWQLIAAIFKEASPTHVPTSHLIITRRAWGKLAKLLYWVMWFPGYSTDDSIGALLMVPNTYIQCKWVLYRSIMVIGSYVHSIAHRGALWIQGKRNIYLHSYDSKGKHNHQQQKTDPGKYLYKTIFMNNLNNLVASM